MLWKSAVIKTFPLIGISLFDVIYQTRETVFHRDIQTARRELKIRRPQISSFWIADETLSRAFDVSSQSKPKLRPGENGEIKS